MENNNNDWKNSLIYDFKRNLSLIKLIKKGDEKAEEVFLKNTFEDSLKHFEDTAKDLKFLLEDNEWNVFTSIISEIRENFKNGLNYKLLEIVWKLNPLMSALEQLVNVNFEDPFFLLVVNYHYAVIKDCIILNIKKLSGFI